MPWIFGDSFDQYAALTDMTLGYWDNGVFTNWQLIAGRFTGSQCINMGNQPNSFAKASTSNDAVHHLIFAYRQAAALTGTALGTYFQLGDGLNAQCSIVIRSDGAMLLTSGGPGGTVLATYTGAVSAQNTWFAYECEVVINNTTGSIAVRKNGNTSNDFSLGSLNTRAGSTNNYANRLTIGQQSTSAPLNTIGAMQLDDVLWRSDAASVAWAGDIRAYQLVPASDAAVQFSRSITTLTQVPYSRNTTTALTTNQARYIAFTPQFDGTVGSVTISVATGYTGNMKCALFNSSGSAPTTVVQSATAAASNPVVGNLTFTFSPPIAVSKSASYYFGFDFDVSGGALDCQNSSGNSGQISTTAYASFPVSNPIATTGQTIPLISVQLTTSANYSMVSETIQDGATTYVYDTVVGHADFYNIQPLPLTPTVIVAVNLRGFVAKSDAGTRVSQMQLKSGATTVQSTTLALATSFLWQNRWDTVDPATGAAWTTPGVNALQIGPLVQA